VATPVCFSPFAATNTRASSCCGRGFFRRSGCFWDTDGDVGQAEQVGTGGFLEMRPTQGTIRLGVVEAGCEPGSERM
jgi:hypothetical protein